MDLFWPGDTQWHARSLWISWSRRRLKSAIDLSDERQAVYLRTSERVLQRTLNSIRQLYSTGLYSDAVTDGLEGMDWKGFW